MLVVGPVFAQRAGRRDKPHGTFWEAEWPRSIGVGRKSVRARNAADGRLGGNLRGGIGERARRFQRPKPAIQPGNGQALTWRP